MDYPGGNDMIPGVIRGRGVRVRGGDATTAEPEECSKSQGVWTPLDAGKAGREFSPRASRMECSNALTSIYVHKTLFGFLSSGV